MSPPPWQFPWQFGGDEHTPSGATPGVFTQKMGFGTKNGIWHILLTGKQLPKGGWYHNGVLARRFSHPHGSSPDNLVGMSPLLQGLLQGCLLKKTGFPSKTAFGTFYSLVSSSAQADIIRMGSLTQGISTPWAAPWAIWWRWVHSFRGYSRSVYSKNRIWLQKMAFGTIYPLVSSSPKGW